MEDSNEDQVILNMPEDINKLCRTCMSVTNNLEICHDTLIIQENKLTDVADMLFKCFLVKINVEDGLPNSICQQCANQIEIAYNFKLQCEKSECNLRDLLNLPMTTNDVQKEFSGGVVLYDSTKYEKKKTNENEVKKPSIAKEEIDINDDDIFSLIQERKQCPKTSNIEIKDVYMKEEINIDDPEYLCNNCKKSFPDYEMLESHFQNCQNVESQSQCKTLTSYNCQVCGLHFKSISQRNSHLTTHNLKMNGKYEYTCDICSRVFISEAKLALHFYNHILKFSEEASEDSEEEPSCYVCDENLKSSKALSEHVKKEHMVEGILVCEICNEDYDNEFNFIIHLKKHGVQINVCKHCKKKFNSREKLQSHIKFYHVQQNENGSQCPICKQQFTTRKQLKTHSLVHLHEAYECDKCKKQFNNIVSYDTHLKKHTEPRFLCSLCGKQYFSSVTLACHIRSHNNEKPFKCPHCKKAFSSRATLSVHKRIHSTFKPYICSYCGYSCRQSGDLSMHIRTHTGDKPYKCTFPNCERKFTTSSQRKEHYRRHTNERNHKCPVCDRAFLESKTLKVHMLTHTGEKPHSCEICGKKFRRTHHLNNHMKGHREFVKLS